MKLAKLFAESVRRFRHVPFCLVFNACLLAGSCSVSS